MKKKLWLTYFFRSSTISVVIIGIASILCGFLLSLHLDKSQVTEVSTLSAEEVTTERKFFLVSIPHLSFLEWSDLNEEATHPFLSELIQQGIPGAMNFRTPYHGLDDVYVSIGAGKPAKATNLHGFEQEEIYQDVPAGKLYQRFTGRVATGKIVIPHYMSAHLQNAQTPYTAVPGLLGETLQRFQVERKIYGSLDQMVSISSRMNQVVGRQLESSQTDGVLETKYVRFSPLLLMDKQGTVPDGALGETIYELDWSRPYGIKTNYEALYANVSEIYKQENINDAVVMIELGDLYRLYMQKDYYPPEYFRTLKDLTLTEIQTFIQLLSGLIQQQDCILLFSPSVPKSASAAKLMLTPIIVLSDSKNKALPNQLLISDSTRREGVITYADIAPTIFRYFQIEPPADMTGSPIQSIHSSKKEHWLKSELIRMQNVYRLRYPLLYCFVIYEVIVLLLGLLTSIQTLRLPQLSFMSAALYTLMWAPVTMLWSALFAQHLWLNTAFMIVVTVMLSYFSTRLPLLLSLLIASFITAISIVIDGITGGYLIQHSVLGYDPMIGARYYGIGNEYMGVLVGVVLLSCGTGLQMLSSMMDRTNMLSVKTGFLAVVVFVSALVCYMIHPYLGTNAGGAITALASGTWLCIRLLKQMYQKKITNTFYILTGISVFVLGGFVLWLWNAVLIDSSQQSHIGKALSMLSNGQYEAIMGIIKRKLQMNWHLIGVSSWSKVFITSLFILAFYLVRPFGVFKIWQKQMPLLVSGFSAVSIGAIVALVFNDSGIVAAATMIIYAVVPILLLQSSKVKQSKDMRPFVSEKL